MHVDDEQLQRLLHGELDPAARTIVVTHLAGCAACDARATEAKQQEAEVLRLLHTLDDDQPRVEAAQVIARARASDRSWMRTAASILIAVGIAGTAYAAPGSPIPRWVSAIAAMIANVSDDPPVTTTPATPASQDSVVTGLSMTPEANLVVRFRARQSSGQLRVTLVDASEVTVQSFTASVPYRSDVGRLTIENRGSTADFEVMIPRDAPRVEILVGLERVYLRERGNIAAPLSSDSAGARLIPLGRVP